jgi:hypothetical protein
VADVPLLPRKGLTVATSARNPISRYRKMLDVESALFAVVIVHAAMVQAVIDPDIDRKHPDAL